MRDGSVETEPHRPKPGFASRLRSQQDREDHVIGFERLNYPGKAEEPVRLSFETVGMAAVPLSA